jgi:hypothetical protein
MAALAKLWRFSHKHVIVVAPVDLMAIQAVLHNRRMLKSERPSFFSMAFKTEIVDRISLYHLLSKTAMRVMTACTTHPSFLYRMMGLLVHHHLDIIVAAEAEFRLGRLQALLSSAMDRMAIVAGDTRGLVAAVVPKGKVC